MEDHRNARNSNRLPETRRVARMPAWAALVLDTIAAVVAWTVAGLVMWMLFGA